jgi:hypothetical protein
VLLVHEIMSDHKYHGLKELYEHLIKKLSPDCPFFIKETYNDLNTAMSWYRSNDLVNVRHVSIIGDKEKCLTEWQLRTGVVL